MLTRVLEPLAEKKKRGFENEWLDVSCVRINTESCHDVIKALLDFLHQGIEIPHECTDAFIKRIVSDFKSLARSEIVHALYFFTLRLTDKDDILPFLTKCNDRFRKNHNLFINMPQHQFRKIILSQRYFDVCGFELYIHQHFKTSEYVENLKNWVLENRTVSDTQEAAGKMIKSILSDAIEEESYIDAVGDAVDFFYSAFKLVIEVDGKSHSVTNSDGVDEQNAITKLKTFLLEKQNFSLVRLDVNKIRRDGEAYIRKELSPYINKEKESRQEDYLHEIYEEGSNRFLSITESFEENNDDDFLKSLKPLKRIFNSDNKDHQVALHSWMHDLLRQLKDKECSASHFCFLVSRLVTLVGWNTRMKMGVYDYFTKNPRFQSDIVEQSKIHFDQFTYQNFIEFLSHCAALKMSIDKDFVDTWCIYTIHFHYHLHVNDLHNTLTAFIALDVRPTSEWNTSIFSYTKNKLKGMHASDLLNLMSSVFHLNIQGIPDWCEEWVRCMIPSLHTLQPLAIFTLPKNVPVKDVLCNALLTDAWFSISANQMNNVNIDILSNTTLYYLSKFERPIPDAWLDAFARRIEENIDSLTLREVTMLLQGLAYLLIDPEKIESLLKACQAFIINYDAPTFNKLSIEDLYKIIPSINYFKSGGVDISIDTSQYKDVYEELLIADEKAKEKNALLAEDLKDYFQEQDIEQSKPMEMILRYVNCYIHSHNLIIYVYSEKNKIRSYFNAEILKAYKYDVIKLKREKITLLGKRYINQEVRSYLDHLK